MPQLSDRVGTFTDSVIRHLIRMHFARGTEVLDEAIRRLEKLSALLA